MTVNDQPRMPASGDPDAPLGALLREARFGFDLSVAAVEQETKIRAAYIEALEEGRFGELPPALYIDRILKCLAYYYGLDLEVLRVRYADELSAHERREQEFARLNLAAPTSGVRSFMRPIGDGGYVHAHRLAAVGMGVLALLLLSGYVVHQVQSFSAAPTLELAEPHSDIRVAHRTIMVRGAAEPGAKVTINNQEVLTDEAGHFQVPYELSRGQNVIAVVAEKKNGKITRRSHTVSADYPEPTLPTAPAEGFLATVTTTAATWVRVHLDGAVIYEGILDAEARKTFQGKAELQLRTGNAGTTRVAINGRDQGLVGREGQVASFVYTDPRTVGMADDGTRSAR